MTFELAIRLTEILLAFAFLQQSIEHLYGSKHQAWIFIPRIILSAMLLIGFQTPLACIALFTIAIIMLHRFDGPYNGGSDRMGILILTCLIAIHFMPSQLWQEYIFGYLAMQLILSYFIAGWVKIINSDWRNGQALDDVFRFSAYIPSESLRSWAEYPKTLYVAGWNVMIFELLFPFSLLHQTTLVIALIVATFFHLNNAIFLGLNRFLWIWIAAYPSIIWLQGRIFSI